MYNEENSGGACNCSKCQGHGGSMGGKMGMWMNMPKEVKIAKLEKKEAMLKAELEFLGKMKDMVSKMEDEKKSA